MKFFKDNSYDIVKLYIQQIGISIFSLFLYFAIKAIPVAESSKLPMAVGLSVFSMLFYYVLLYTAAWDMGAKDKIRIDAGRMEDCRGKGAFMACFANVPNFVLGLFSLVCLVINIASNADAGYMIFVVFNFLLRVTTAMYNGLMQGVFAGVRSHLIEDFSISMTESLAIEMADKYYMLWQTVGFLIIPVVAVLVTHLGYRMGVREKRLTAVFRLKNKE